MYFHFSEMALFQHLQMFRNFLINMGLILQEARDPVAVLQPVGGSQKHHRQIFFSEALTISIPEKTESIIMLEKYFQTALEKKYFSLDRKQGSFYYLTIQYRTMRVRECCLPTEYRMSFS